MSDLIATLAAAGAVEAKGGFTIDPEKAREKLRQYQLAEPQRYVLLLVEAAVSSGANRLEFEIDSDDVILRFDGPAFRPAQLENLYGSLFADLEAAEDGDPSELGRLRGLQQLAYALNSAMALNPRFATITSVDAQGLGARLELRPDARDQLETLASSGAGLAAGLGNTVHVKDRFRPGLVVEFFRSLRGNLVEIQLLREHCRWSRTPVSINRELVSGPIAFEGEFWTELDVLDRSRGTSEPVVIGRAVLGLRDAEAELVAAEAVLLSNGVFIERVAVLGGLPGFMAIVDSPRFGKDVSQTKLLRDAGFDAVMAAITEAQARTIARLAERCIAAQRAAGQASGQAGQVPDWAEPLLLEWLTQVEVPSLRRALRDDEIFALVAEVPLWPIIGAAEPLTTRALIEADELLYAREPFDFVPAEVAFVLDLHNDRLHTRERLLDRLFPSDQRDYTEALRREYERERRRLEFMARTHAPALDEDRIYQVRAAIRGERIVGVERRPIRGEIGIDVLSTRDSWVRLVHAGCLLREQHIDHPLPGLSVVVEAELTPTDEYNAARPDAALAGALVAALEALLRGMTELAASGEVSPAHAELRELLLGFIAEVAEPDYAVAFLVQFGFTRSAAHRELGRLLGPDEHEIRPRWQLDDPDASHPLARVPLIPRVLGRPATLVEVAALRTGGSIPYLEPEAGPFPVLDREVLVVDHRTRRALTALLRPTSLRSFASELAWTRRREQFWLRPTVELGFEIPADRRQRLAQLASNRAPRLTATVAARFAEILATVAIPAGASADPNLRGQLGLTEFASTEAERGRTRVRVLYRERELCVTELELPLPGLIAWVESSTLEVDAEFEQLADPVALRRPLLHALADLVAHQLGRARAQPDELRPCEWWLLAMVPSVVLGRGGLANAFLRLRAARGQDAAIAELDPLLALLERVPERDLDRALGQLRGRGELPLAKAVDTQLRSRSRRPGASEQEALELRRRLVPSFAELLELQLLRRFTGAAVRASSPRTLNLASVYERVSADQPLAWVGEDYRLDGPLPQVEFAIAALDPIEQRLLQDQLGAEALERVDEWLRGRARFERRKTITEVRVPRGAVLTVIEVSGQGWRGELGIVRESPRHVQRSKIRVFVDRREAAVVDLPATRVPVLGALSFDAIELNERFDDLSSDARETVRRLVEARLDELLVDFVARFPRFERDERERAHELARYLLATWPPGTGGYAARAKRQGKLFRALAELPVFAGARKRWSAAELAETHRRDGSLASIRHRSDVPLPEGPVVLIDRDEVESTLEALFGRPRDLHAEHERERELAARKAAAPRLPDKPPSHALATLAIDDERLTGWLWLERGAAEVLFGAEGVAVDRRRVSSTCACAGAISGPGLSIGKDWTRVVLSRSQERMLERRAVALWTTLADEFVDEPERAPRGKAERQRLVASRDLLRGLFMRLHDEFGRGRSDSQRKRKGNRHERLYERLREAALLELNNGRWISADVAARERPIELAALELWTGPSAEELAHQRALERREAERLRAQLAQEREQERERRAAELRELEATRRKLAQREAQREAQQAKDRERQAKARQDEARQAEARAARTPKRGAQARVVVAPTPTPAELLLSAIREELRLVRANNRGLVSNRILDTLALGSPDRRGPLLRQTGERSELNPEHPLFVATLAGYLDDPGLLTLLASTAYSFLNIIHVEIEDADEAEFLRLHAAYVATRIE